MINTARAYILVQACLSLLIALTFAMASGTTGAAEDRVTTIYIVRHAEKDELRPGQKEPPGPGLTDAGVKRAKTLATLLKEVGVKAIYVNDYFRTQETAKPTNIETGAPVMQIHDPTETVKHILDNHLGRTVLIVGRTTTVDDLGRALGVKIPTLRETQYDRMFIVRRSGDKSELQTRRYGEKSPE